MANGQFSQGLRIIEAGLQEFTDTGRLLSRYFLEFTLAEIYFQMATRPRRLGFWSILKNLGSILKEVPFSRRKAEAYLSKFIQDGKEIGAGGFMQSHAARHLELLHPAKGPG